MPHIVPAAADNDIGTLASKAQSLLVVWCRVRRGESDGRASSAAGRLVELATPADVTAQLRAAGSVFAEDEAELLWREAATPDQLRDMVAQRTTGRPLEQILGWAEFCGLRILVEPGVFVPRQRTTFLVQLAAGVVNAGDVAVDLCCGTGAVGAALAT